MINRLRVGGLRVVRAGNELALTSLKRVYQLRVNGLRVGVLVTRNSQPVHINPASKTNHQLLFTSVQGQEILLRLISFEIFWSQL